jgi:hypothetical protein
VKALNDRLSSTHFHEKAFKNNFKNSFLVFRILRLPPTNEQEISLPFALLAETTFARLGA